MIFSSKKKMNVTDNSQNSYDSPFKMNSRGSRSPLVNSAFHNVKKKKQKTAGHVSSTSAYFIVMEYF